MSTSDPSPAAASSLEEITKIERPGIGGFISFIIAVLFFSGLMETPEWWGIFDYTTLNGNAGKLVAAVSSAGGEISTTFANFRGKGGSGAIDGFLFAIYLVPTIMLAVAMVKVFEHYGAIKAAGWLLNPILRPVLGLPGCTALSLIASLQSTDAGAVMTRTLKDAKLLTEKQVIVYATFQMTADAAIGNFLSSGIVLFTLTANGVPAVPTTIGACLGVILLGKFFSANMMRLVLIRRGR